MRHYIAIPSFVPLFVVALSVMADEKPAERGSSPNDAIKIRFPKDGYTFTRDEVAKGIKVEYSIDVAEDFASLVPSKTSPGYAERPGPSGLYPHEEIAGGGHSYCIRDVGIPIPAPLKPMRLKKGEYSHSIEWDGRNWDGPSDTGNPKGKPFAAGMYEVRVSVHGYAKTKKGVERYVITETAKLVLK